MRQPYSVLQKERIVNRNRAQLCSDGIARDIGDHERKDHRVIVRHLKNDNDGGHRGAHDAGEDRPHAHQGKRSGACERVGENVLGQ